MLLLVVSIFRCSRMSSTTTFRSSQRLVATKASFTFFFALLSLLFQLVSYLLLFSSLIYCLCLFVSRSRALSSLFLSLSLFLFCSPLGLGRMFVRLRLPTGHSAGEMETFQYESEGDVSHHNQRKRTICFFGSSTYVPQTFSHIILLLWWCNHDDDTDWLVSSSSFYSLAFCSSCWSYCTSKYER